MNRLEAAPVYEKMVEQKRLVDDFYEWACQIQYDRPEMTLSNYVEEYIRDVYDLAEIDEQTYLEIYRTLRAAPDDGTPHAFILVHLRREEWRDE